MIINLFSGVIMGLKLQTETPSEHDIFEGQSHEKVASMMAGVMRQPGINIVGLEGELGSGKSTIIHFLQKKLHSEFTFINFDAERYHHGSTKKALIDVIHKGISKSDGVNIRALDKFKNKALGNIVEYEKKVKSRLSWWTVAFVFLSLLSVQMIRYLIADVNYYLTETKPLSGFVLIAESIGFASPIILLFSLWVRGICCKNRKHDDAITTVGDLFKQNSVDRISETWLISREVGTIELTEALSGFTSSETLAIGTRFILIIDNLDRISAEKVKELWSDMELIAGATHEQFRIIIPYSARQVATSLSVEGHSGREFIAKRIPVCFSVPPLITAGWQDAFQKLWQESVHASDLQSCLEAIQLLERWRPTEYPRITPRLMKKFVNDIHILDLTVPAQDDFRHILIALYILVVRYGEKDISNLLRVPVDDSEDFHPPTPDDVLTDRLQATVKQLNRIFNNDTIRWSEFLMSVHYQAEKDLARSELFDTPLTEAVKEHNGGKLELLINLWGFNHAWARVASRINMSDGLITLGSLPVDMLDVVIKEVNSTMQSLNATYALKHRASLNEKFSKTLLNLLSLEKIEKKAFMMRQRNFIVADLNTIHSADDYNALIIPELLCEANIYSAIFDENLLGEIDYELDGNIYANHLLNKEVELINLRIDKLILCDDSIESMLRVILDDVLGDIFLAGVLRHINLSTSAVQRIVVNKKNDLPKQVSASYNKFSQQTVIEGVLEFRKIIFFPGWSNTNHLSYYDNQIHIREKHPADFSAQIVAHMVAINNYDGIENHEAQRESEDFLEYLENYFCYSVSFDSVIKSLSNDRALPFVCEAIKNIINGYKIYSISTPNFIRQQYSLIKMRLPDALPLQIVEKRETAALASLDVNSIEKISPLFLNDLFSSEGLTKIKQKLYILSQDVYSSEQHLYEAFGNIEANRIIVLKDMEKSGVYVSMSENINLFADWYRHMDEKEIEKAVNIHLLWTLLKEEQRIEIIEELHDVLLERETGLQRRIFIIHDFYQELTYKEPEDSNDRRSIAALFNASLEDPILAEWLDKQTFNFSKWPKGDARTATVHIIENKGVFPNICASSLYIKNRIDEKKTSDTVE
ncbi:MULTISPECIES: P-loop NTPase fold protein [unclassified Serratia (in: enterobacteria)]|uniref:P-loop NTPase fold protein n=1 Tax=unclassified Serratia (in: enterobacteria) TaxID=2647522 RepID=UPI001CC0CE15|nr:MULTISPECIES: P-loop NTPase fold protein [unclassified Serratia (in: enterobacteria)]UAN51632.1 hypothetical protein KGP26_00605 [Serratia sp. JSRIV002]UAN57637.1 hypothetical protein KGP21_00605 [Serratia sp. JSRIV004]